MGVSAKKNEISDQKEESTTAEAKTEDTQKEEEIDIDLNDPDVEEAATKIQAGFKGMKARKEVSAKKNEIQDQKEESTTAEAKAEYSKKEEEIDIDLNDPDVEQAATKIQAGF